MSKPLGQMVLHDVADLIKDQQHWAQGGYGKWRNIGTWTRWEWVRAYCLDGAIREASKKYGGQVAAEQARKMIYSVMPWKGPTQHQIHRWNDQKGRTHPEVLNLVWTAHNTGVPA